MDYTMKEHRSQTSVSFGFAIPGVFEFGYNYNDNKYTKSVQKIRRASSKVKTLFPFPLASSRSKISAVYLIALIVSSDQQLCESQSRAGAGPVHAEVGRFDASP